MVATARARARSSKLLVAALLVALSVLALASAAPASPTTAILDDFDRGLEDPLTQWENWEPQSIDGSGPTLEALGGTAGVDEGDVHGDSYRTEPLPPGDAEVYGTIAVNPSDQRWMQLYLNLQDAGTPGVDGYEARWFHWIAGDGFYLRKIVNGVSTNFAGSPLQVSNAEEPGAGDQLLLRRVGTQLQFWHRKAGTWILRLTANDSEFTGGRIGIGTDENKARWGDFGGTGETTDEPDQLPVPATGVIDDFDRDDEDPLSQDGGWSSTPTFGTGETLEVLSEAAGQNEGTVVEANSFRQETLSDDAEVHARISAMPDNDQASYLYLNLQDQGTAGVDGYRLRWYHWIVADMLTIEKIVNGVATTLVGPARVDPQVGHTLLLRRLGNMLELWWKTGPTMTKLLTTVDPQFNAGRLGLGLNDQNGRWDDFGGGTLAEIQELSERFGLTIGACGNGVFARSQDDCVSDPVNSLTGAFTTTETDLEIPGVGVPLAWRRSYTSIDTTEGRLGPGWVDSFDASLTIEQDGDVRARAETGQRVVFTKNPDGTFSGGVGTHSTLVETATSYELTLQDQTKYTFDLSGKLISKVDRHGIGVTLAYDGQGRLSTVTDTANRQLTLSYNPADLVSSVADSAGRDVEYTYDAQGRLETVTDARGKVWTYAYDGATSRLVSLRNPLGQFPYRNTYDPVSGRVTSQLDALGHETTFAWNAAEEIATVTDPAGKQWVSDYDDGKLAEKRDPLGNTTRYTYDQNGFVNSTTDARGNTTTMTNDARGNMVARTAPAPLSHLEEWSYNARNDVTSHTDRRGNVTDFSYDADGDLTTITGPDPDDVGPLGRPVTTYTRDPETGLVTAIRKPNEEGQATPKETLFEYDPAGTGNLLSQTTPTGSKTSYGYDAAGRVTSLVEPRGNVSGCGCAAEFTWNYSFDAAGNRTQALSPDPDGAGTLARLATDFGYDDVGRLETVTNAKGKVTRYEYNAANERVKEIAPNLSEVRAEYDSRGNLTAEVDQLGKRTTYGYDDANRRTTMVDPRGNEIPADPNAFKWTYGYDPNGNLTTVTSPDPDGAGPVTASVTTHAFDVLNRRWATTDPLGHMTSQSFDGNGNVTQVSRPDPDGAGPLLPNVTHHAYDALNRLTVLTDGEGKQTTYAYDLNGNRTAVTTPRGTTRFTFDADDRMSTRVEARENVSGCDCMGRHTWTYAYDTASHIVSVTSPDPDGAGSQTPSVTQFAYDRVGQRESRTDALSRTVRWTYDELGQLSKATTPDLVDTLYAYDADTNDLVSRTDALGHVTRFGYDLAHRRTSLKRAFGTPLERTWTYAYDAAGNQTQIVDAKANAAANPALGTTTFAYDPLGRQTGIDYSDTTPDVSFAYDKAGKRVSMTDAAGQETYSYDNADRLQTVARGPDTFSYGYDKRDLVTKRTYPDGTVLDYAYADDGRLASVTSGGQTVGYGYDAAGNLETTMLPSGNGHVESRLYDNVGRLTEVRHQKGQTVLNRATYTLDPVGNPTTIVRASGTETYTYDAQDRLTEACFQASCAAAGDPFIRWTYDAVGNRQTEARPTGTTIYTYNAADQLTGRSGLGGSVTYAYDDNGNQVQAGSRTFTYDVAGRTKSTTQASTTTSYTYGGDGKRLEASNVSGGGGPTAPTLRTPCSTAIGTSGTATVPKPTGTVAGDLLVVGIAFEKGWDVAITAPSGWTLVRRTNQSSNVGYATYRKTAGASEPASYAFTLTNSPKWSIGSCAIAGAHATTPIDVLADATGVNGNPSAPSVTTTGTQRLVLAFYANKKPTTYSSYTAPAVERWDRPNTSGGLPSNALASYTQAAAGATGAKSATAGEQAEWVAQQLAIAPAPAPPVTNTTRYLWDANHPLPELALERDTQGQLLRRYLHGNDLYSMQTPAGSFYYHADGLGSVTNMTDAAGVKQWTHVWEPFGTTRTQTQDSPTAPANPMRFTGEYEDPTGLYHLRARQYDPVAGRFLATDPLEQSVGDPAVSPYAFVSNRATVLVDPSGLCGESLGFFVAGFCNLGEELGNAALGTGEAGVHVLGQAWDGIAGLPGGIAHLASCYMKGDGEFAFCLYELGAGALGALYDQLTACLGSYGTDMRTATRRCMKLALGVVAGGAVFKTLKAVSRGHKGRGAKGADLAGGPQLWTRTEVLGRRVYQRNDLIDPMRTNAKGETSLSLMRRGLAPIGPDGRPVQLHHLIQREPGPVAEVTQSFHQANSAALHVNPSNTIPSGVDRAAFRRWKASYWERRARDFG